jgi:hypothetical protein
MHGRRLTGRHFEFEDGYATAIGDVTQMTVLAHLDVWDRYLVCFVDSPNDCAAGKRLELDDGLFFEDAFAFGVRHADDDFAAGDCVNGDGVGVGVGREVCRLLTLFGSRGDFRLKEGDSMRLFEVWSFSLPFDDFRASL